ncbi:hypothetical protein KSP39_PZI001921 [Platanthera zijinensis]|uniref:Uncharacterized protein n=1 Tax=Platanthera zijinensis TaxID=2320716 RepID=A0AAP0BZU8_9ASPA
MKEVEPEMTEVQEVAFCRGMTKTLWMVARKRKCDVVDPGFDDLPKDERVDFDVDGNDAHSLAGNHAWVCALQHPRFAPDTAHTGASAITHAVRTVRATACGSTIDSEIVDLSSMIWVEIVDLRLEKDSTHSLCPKFVDLCSTIHTEIVDRRGPKSTVHLLLEPKDLPFLFSLVKLRLSVCLLAGKDLQVPTMAIEKVLIADNTSVIADEILSHRLENDTPNERNTIVFKMDVHCNKRDPRLTVAYGDSVYFLKSDQLKWLPNGSELLMESPSPSAKSRTFTSFSCSQTSLPQFSGNHRHEAS